MAKRFGLGYLIGAIALVGMGVVAGVRSIDYTPQWDQSSYALPPSAPAPARDLAAKYPEHSGSIAELVSARPHDASQLLETHGIRAPRAFVALGEPGLALLPKADEMPNFVFYIESPVAASAGTGLHPIAAFLAELAERDPKRADDLFYCFTRMSDRQADLLAKYPQALPILAVAPASATGVIETYGEPAVSMMLRFTPDSYAEIARVLAADGQRVFRARDALITANPQFVAARQDVLDSFLALYFIEYGDISRWLEQRLGFEQAMFVMSNNMDFLHGLQLQHGRAAVRSALQTVIGYADSQNPAHKKIAEICFAIPGALPLFVETQHIAGVRDRFLENYGMRGGASLITQGFDRALWGHLLKAVDADGDGVLVPLAVLVENGALHRVLDLVANGHGEGYNILDTLRAVAHALSDDGGPAADTFRMVDRTLAMMINGHWNDIPDDYLSREVMWIWDVLPGRDAFRLVRMMMNGYSPTLFESANGLWDGANVVMFAYNVGGAVIDCTQNVASAMGEQSFSALAKAIGIVAKNAVGHVFERLVESISQPRNYIRLALCAGYFAYDAFLTYAPMEIPNRARLIEINEKYLTASVKGMLFDVVKEVGLHALVWRPEFDHKNLNLEAPIPPADLLKLSEGQRIAFELSRMDYRIKRAFIDMLDANERRRKFLKMLGMAQQFAPGQGADKMDDLLPPKQEKPFDPLDPKGESEEMSVPPADNGIEPVAYVLVEGQRVPLHAPRFRNLTPGSRTSQITGRIIDIPRGADQWQAMQTDPRFVAFCLEEIVDLMAGR